MLNLTLLSPLITLTEDPSNAVLPLARIKRLMRSDEDVRVRDNCAAYISLKSKCLS